MVAVKPFAALGLLAFAGIVTVAFVWPVAHLTAILAVTSIVPWAIQNQYGFGGGAGLVLSDVLILTSASCAS